MDKEKIQIIKKDLQEFFQKNEKAPSDILINELINTQLGKQYGELLIKKLDIYLNFEKNIQQEGQIFKETQILKDFLGEKNLELLFCSKQELGQLKKKGQINLLIKNFLRLYIGEIKNLYIWKWDFYQKLIEFCDLKNDFRKKLIENIRNYRNSVRNQPVILKVAILSIICLHRFDYQLYGFSIQQVWQHLFQEQYPTFLKIKNQNRKKRICDKPYKPRQKNQEGSLNKQQSLTEIFQSNEIDLQEKQQSQISSEQDQMESLYQQTQNQLQNQYFSYNFQNQSEDNFNEQNSLVNLNYFQYENESIFLQSEENKSFQHSSSTKGEIGQEDVNNLKDFLYKSFEYTSLSFYTPSIFDALL